MRPRARRLLVAALLTVPVAACTDDDPSVSGSSTTAPSTTAPGETTETTAPVPAGTLDSIGLTTTEVAELDEPVAMAARPGSPDLYIAEKGGRVRLVEVTTNETTEAVTYEVQRTPLLDLSDDVINEGERGLLGMTFSSDGRTLFLDYTRQPDGHTVVVSYELGDRPTIDDDSRRELLVVEQPFANHNGGQLVTGPDGYLYVGLGDGGDGGDPQGNGQDTTTLLGSILRIDPAAGSEDGPAYGIPPGNPFADGEDGRPEIWLYGVRNPWRFTFDARTGDLWVADVGQGQWEEVNRLPSVGGFDAGRGDNLGWNEMEGTHPFDGGENPPGGILPIHEYSHDSGCSVAGGYVYHGDDIAGLDGVYLFGDYCARGLRGLELADGTVIDTKTWDLPIEQLYSFGQDDDGELYFLLADGRVLKLDPA